ncbi:MAG: SUMF1/EgtB/PvdO family nonheme iron enzyme [Spirochaetaceae bacterium]|jgi:hypothetical protein|nr:SUMF1/EgtB/PvdO family nonheme iron enzyme [Spirochaetaceae bacterium]
MFKKIEPDDWVRLPRVCGVRAGVCLFALCALAALAALFFLLLHPGLSRPGVMLSVESEPWGAAVRIDDVYYGSAPCRIFVPEGARLVTLALPGFAPQSERIVAGARLFGSRFFPKTMSLRAKLAEEGALSALVDGARDYAAWSFAGEPTEAYQIPLSLSEGVYRSAPADADAARGAAALVEAAARFAVTRAALKDLLRAEFLAHGGGNAASPTAAMAAARGVFSFLTKNPSFVLALGDVLPEETAHALVNSKLYPRVWADGDEDEPQNVAAPSNVMRAPLFVEGVEFAVEFSSPASLMVARDEVSFSSWERFLAENPAWNAANRDALAAEGKANDEYLRAFEAYKISNEQFQDEFPGHPPSSVSGVSFFAAEAFCAWLDAKLPSSLAKAYEVRLPSEIEWEYAAKFAADSAGSSSASSVLRGMTLESYDGAGLWEWCSDFFAPLADLSSAEWARELLGSPERSVRGGCWVNRSDSLGKNARGSLSPDAASPFTGFRPVIAARK